MSWTPFRRRAAVAHDLQAETVTATSSLPVEATETSDQVVEVPKGSAAFVARVKAALAA